jgi:hypothetical protein
MKKFVPAAIFILAIVCSTSVIAFILFPYGKNKVKENNLVRANNEINDLLAIELDEERLTDLWLTGNSNFDYIIASIESDAERQRFLGVTLVRLSDYEGMYEYEFESRYPRYKAYRDMVKELSRQDYSEWVGSIIKGVTETEFEANVFDYLSTLKDNRYLNDAISRFIEILNKSSSSGFSAQSNKDAFIIGSLSLYIMQFPGNNAILRNALGEKADQFLRLSDSDLTEIRGIPLNQVYVYLYLKYFGLENIINRKMEVFLNSGTGRWNGRTGTMSAVNSLINYFSSTGKGMSQNFYSLIQSGFDRNDSIRIYIALQVLKKIGFDDSAPSFNNLLNRVSRRESNLEITTTEYLNGVPIRTTTREVIFSDEVAELRSAVAGKTDIPFDTMLNSALKTSSQTGNFIIPRVTATEVVNKEVSEMSGQYTNNFVSESIKAWENKNNQLTNMRIFEIAVAVFSCAVVFYKKRKNTGAISSLILPYGIAVSLALFIAFALNSWIAAG